MLLHIATPEGRALDFRGLAPVTVFETWWRHVYEMRWTASLLPSNATRWERALEAVDADLVARTPVGLITASRSVMDCPLAWLPYLAAERSVDEFSSDWPEARQRAATEASLALHKVKGTRPSLDVALRPLGLSPQVAEWFETTGRQANTFRVAIDIDRDRTWGAGDRSELIRVVNGAKNLHTKLEVLDLRRRARPAALYLGGLPTFARTLRIGQHVRPNLHRQTSMVWVGATTIRHRTLRVGPRQRN